MKRSRLKLFKTTSLTFSLIGIILILFTAGVFIYMGVTGVTSSISSTVDNSGSYDDLSVVKAQYANVSSKYDSIKSAMSDSKDYGKKDTYNNGRLKLSEVNGLITEIEGDISRNQPKDQVNAKINQAKQLINEADEIYTSLGK